MSTIDKAALIEQAAELLSVHRWKSMGLNTVECECGAILSGGMELTGFPADQAFRDHIATATLPVVAKALLQPIRNLHWEDQGGGLIVDFAARSVVDGSRCHFCRKPWPCADIRMVDTIEAEVQP